MALIGAHAEILGAADATPAWPRGPQISPHCVVWLLLTRTDPGEINPRITRSLLERKSPAQDTVVCISPRCAQTHVPLVQHSKRDRPVFKERDYMRGSTRSNDMARFLGLISRSAASGNESGQVLLEKP